MPPDIREALEHHWRSLLTAPAHYLPEIRASMDALLDRAARLRTNQLSHNDAFRREFLLEDDDTP